MKELIEFKKVSFSYDGLKVLKDFTFSVKKGDFFGIVGPNGSGKSTLLKLANGILKPQAGMVFFKGNDLTRYSRMEIASYIASVPQVFHLDFYFTCEEVIKMGLYAKKTKKDKLSPSSQIERILRRMELEDMRGRFFPELSGGERQRVILAQALAQEPEVLLLDEPAANLDVAFQLKLFDFLKELNQQGMTIICVVHDLNLAISYFEKIALLYKGRVLAKGSYEEVLTPALLEKAYGIKSVLHKHSGKPFLTFSVSQTVTGFKGRVHLICGGGTGSFLMRELTEAGFLVTAGVVNALDTDEFTGRELSLAMAVEAPFSSISDEAFWANQDLIRQADLVILTNVPIGEGNFRNLEALKWAAENNKEVWVVEKNIEKRDFTGKALKILSNIKRAKFLKDNVEVLSLIREKKWGS